MYSKTLSKYQKKTYLAVSLTKFTLKIETNKIVFRKVLNGLK